MQGILMTPETHRAIRELRKTQTRRVDKLANKIAVTYDRTWVHFNKRYNWWELKGRSNISELIEPFVIEPRYQLGETVYLKEAYWFYHRIGTQANIKYLSDNEVTWVFIPKDKPTPNVGYHSPLMLPAWAARDFITITDVLPQRLQEITEEDAKAEGSNPFLVDKLKGGTKYKMMKTYHHEFYPLVDHADKNEIVVFECPNMGYARLHHTQWKEKQDPIFRIPAKEVFEYVGTIEPNYKNGFCVLWDSVNRITHPFASNPWVFKYSFQLKD